MDSGTAVELPTSIVFDAGEDGSPGGGGAPAGGSSAGADGAPSGAAGSFGASDSGAGGGSGTSGMVDAGTLVDWGTYFPDPVLGSEGDTTLQGIDSDNNGVRDDLEAFILTLEADPRKQIALASFARESTAMMVLGGTAGTTKVVALAQAQRVGRTIDCLHDLYAPDVATRQGILIKVRSALYDNALRLGAYNHASTLVSGSIFHGGHGCDSAITGVFQ